MATNRKLTISLNEKEIDALCNKLTSIAGKLDKMGKKIVDEASNLAIDEMTKNYQNSQYEEGSETDFFQKGTETEKQVGMTGEQVIYTEFGTGTEGEMNPHPQKEEFSLNPYNSGKTIRRATKEVHDKHGIGQGELYWTYKDKNGEVKYTQGIPAQKIVYNADEKLKEDLPAICKKAVEEVLDDFSNSNS